MKVIKIVGTARGAPTEFAGQYVMEYQPMAIDSLGHYKGGKLVTTPDLSQALRFEGAADAMRCWQRQNGWLPNGKPNRPLTAFTVEISNEEDCNDVMTNIFKEASHGNT